MLSQVKTYRYRSRSWLLLAAFAIITSMVSGSTWLENRNSRTASAALQPKIVAGYWQMWQGPRVSELASAAPQYNLFLASFALGSDSNGHVEFNPVFSSGNELKNDLAASRALGNTWLISVGGGSDSTVRLLNETHATNMFNSLVGIVDAYGFQGVDLDLECGSGCFNPTAAASLASKLKSKYGSGFIMSASPRPYEARSPSDIYAAFALAAGNNLNLFNLQFYDFPETRNTAQLTAIVNSDLAAMIGMGIPASKITIGCLTYHNYAGGWNTVEVYKTIYQQQVAKYPSLRGVSIWETSLDKLENWSFAKTMGPVVGPTKSVSAPANPATPKPTAKPVSVTSGGSGKATIPGLATVTPAPGALGVSPSPTVSPEPSTTPTPASLTPAESTKAIGEVVKKRSQSNLALIITLICLGLALLSIGGYFGVHKAIEYRNGEPYRRSSDWYNPFT